jgi:5-methylcytosine-specific restriction endonuclease McrBC regulatory subunit McrC
VLIVEILERDSRVFPREELFDASGRSKVFADTRALSVVELKDVAQGVQLRALGLIGVLPLTPDISLNIKPKFPLSNLWLLLAAADEAYDRLLPVIRSYEHSSGGAPHQLLARIFCHYLEQIMQQNLARAYFGFEHRGHYLPKVNLGRTLSTYASRGDMVRVVSDAVAFSTALPVNGYLKSACLAFLRLIPSSTEWENERALINDALNSLDRVRMRNMFPMDVATAEQVPSWIREPYTGALSTFGLLLGYNRIGFGFASEGTRLPSFLFSLDTVFEQFVRNSLRNYLQTQSISVFDGNAPRHQLPLFQDSRRFPVKPDLIFREGRTVLGLGEVKYKPRIEEADRYQLISHVIAHKAPVGIWFSPVVGRERGMSYVGTTGGARFYHYRFDLAAELAAEKDTMFTEVSRLLRPAAAAA